MRCTRLFLFSFSLDHSCHVTVNFMMTVRLSHVSSRPQETVGLDSLLYADHAWVMCMYWYMYVKTNFDQSKAFTNPDWKDYMGTVAISKLSCFFFLFSLHSSVTSCLSFPANDHPPSKRFFTRDRSKLPVVQFSAKGQQMQEQILAIFRVIVWLEQMKLMQPRKDRGPGLGRFVHVFPMIRP